MKRFTLIEVKRKTSSQPIHFISSIHTSVIFHASTIYSKLLSTGGFFPKDAWSQMKSNDRLIVFPKYEPKQATKTVLHCISIYCYFSNTTRQVQKLITFKKILSISKLYFQSKKVLLTSKIEKGNREGRFLCKKRNENIGIEKCRRKRNCLNICKK